jgi:hypothetical protein
MCIGWYCWSCILGSYAIYLPSTDLDGATRVPEELLLGGI